MLDKAGNVVDEWDSKKGETHKVKNLIVGQEYTLRETIAPNGYTLTTDTTFTIDRTGKVTGTVMINLNYSWQSVIVAESQIVTVF